MERFIVFQASGPSPPATARRCITNAASRRKGGPAPLLIVALRPTRLPMPCPPRAPTSCEQDSLSRSASSRRQRRVVTMIRHVSAGSHRTAYSKASYLLTKCTKALTDARPVCRTDGSLGCRSCRCCMPRSRQALPMIQRRAQRSSARSKMSRGSQRSHYRAWTACSEEPWFAASVPHRQSRDGESPESKCVGSRCRGQP